MKFLRAGGVLPLLAKGDAVVIFQDAVNDSRAISGLGLVRELTYRGFLLALKYLSISRAARIFTGRHTNPRRRILTERELMERRHAKEKKEAQLEYLKKRQAQVIDEQDEENAEVENANGHQEDQDELAETPDPESLSPALLELLTKNRVECIGPALLNAGYSTVGDVIVAYDDEFDPVVNAVDLKKPERRRLAKLLKQLRGGEEKKEERKRVQEKERIQENIRAKRREERRQREEAEKREQEERKQKEKEERERRERESDPRWGVAQRHAKELQTFAESPLELWVTMCFHFKQAFLQNGAIYRAYWKSAPDGLLARFLRLGGKKLHAQEALKVLTEQKAKQTQFDKQMKYHVPPVVTHMVSYHNCVVSIVKEFGTVPLTPQRYAASLFSISCPLSMCRTVGRNTRNLCRNCGRNREQSAWIPHSRRPDKEAEVGSPTTRGGPHNF